jgi:prepilin signal peptidase PulO-like enzyme (type II secretory pathway)
MVILFVFGVAIGSFLNVVALRLNSGLSILGRSGCASCGRALSWWELMPILSFFILRGKCRECHAKISWQYPLVELWTGLIFISIYNLQFSIYKEFSPDFIVHCSLLLVIFSIYIVITIYDIRHKIIPDQLVYLSVILSLIVPLSIVHYSLLDWLTGPILFLFFASIWLVSKGRAMGFGDAKLALSLGLLLGAQAGFSATILSFWIGAIFGLTAIIYGWLNPLLSRVKKFTMKSEIPFAPFLILGAWLSVVFQLDLLHVSLF